MKFMTKLKDCCVDLVLTDPPYNISRKNNFKSMGRSGVDFGEWDKDFDQLSYLEGVFRILKMGGVSSYL
jgi:DNA modification methylase